jgi:hypothetical protein
LLLVNTARYKYPFIAVLVGLIVKVEVVVVAPAVLLTLYGLAMVRLLKPEPVFNCHCTVEPGTLLATAVMVADTGVQTVAFAGCVFIVGTPAPPSPTIKLPKPVVLRPVACVVVEVRVPIAG